MSRLESKAKTLLGPLVLNGKEIQLDKVQQNDIAAWVAEMFMAYALTLGRLENPFSDEQYRRLAETSTCPPGLRIWVAQVNSRYSQVGMAIRPWFLGSGIDPLEDQNNAALGFVAIGGLVFLLVVSPDEMRDVSLLLQPPAIEANAPIAQVFPPGPDISLGCIGFDEEYMDSVQNWLALPSQLALPAPAGLSPESLGKAEQYFSRGASPQAIRRPVAASPPSREFLQEAALDEQRARDEAGRFLEGGDHFGAVLALKRHSRVHFLKGDFAGAIRLQMEAVAVPGSDLDNDAQEAYYVGQCYWNLSDSRAESWYQRAITLGMDAPEPRFGIVDARVWDGRYADALAMLVEIEPEGDRQEAVKIVAVEALGFLVEDLGLRTQKRATVDPDGMVMGSMDSSSAYKAIIGVDAISRPLWRVVDDSDLRLGYHFARAWFGDHPASWMMIALAVAERDAGHAEPVFRLGLDRIPELFEYSSELLDSLEVVGLGDRAIFDICRKVISESGQ